MIAQVESLPTELDVTFLPCIDGIVQVFTAPHRSFFTNVMAQAIQSAAQGTPTLLVQFMKGGIGMGHESPICLCQNLTWLRCGLPRCISTPNVAAEERDSILALWNYTREQILSDRFSVVILDELSLAVNLGLIPEVEVMDLVSDRPRRLDLILTGPEMPNSILDQADQITELRRSIYA